VLTIIGVMIVTFVLFRVIAGDIAAAHVGEKATEQMKADWRHAHGYDRPRFLNFHRQLLITDNTAGQKSFSIKDLSKNGSIDALTLIPSDEFKNVRMGKYIFRLSSDTPIETLVGKNRLGPQTIMQLSLSDGKEVKIDLSGTATCGEMIEAINTAPANKDEKTNQQLVSAEISQWSFAKVLNSQFADHLLKSATFQARSLKDNQKLTSVISERAPRSLALTIPALAVGWFAAMIISCFVAYYRNSVVDKAGVFLSVLGMCIPFLAFMIYGQWLMFELFPKHAYGLAYRANIYVPITIMVIAGLGGSVRFYRTVILDETNRDYVRTARAKGLPLPAVLFKHVLKNCMLPILTNLILTLPYLIMGSLLTETYFGIPGLGDLMLSSINGKDEPILSGLVFLSSLIYTISILVTDLSYAVFDPRIRLQ